MRKFRAGRVTAVFVLLAVLCWQTASIAGEYSQHQSTEHCCLLCHTGPLPFLQTAVLSAAAPVLYTRWLERPADSNWRHDPLLIARCSRAPPA